MESNNEIVVGLVPRAVALALAGFTTAFISVSVAVVFTGASLSAFAPAAGAAVAAVKAVAGL